MCLTVTSRIFDIPHKNGWIKAYKELSKLKVVNSGRWIVTTPHRLTPVKSGWLIADGEPDFKTKTRLVFSIPVMELDYEELYGGAIHCYTDNATNRIAVWAKVEDFIAYGHREIAFKKIWIPWWRLWWFKCFC